MIVVPLVLIVVGWVIYGQFPLVSIALFITATMFALRAMALNRAGG